MRPDRKPLVAYLSSEGTIIIEYDDRSATNFGNRAEAVKVIKDHGLKLYDSWAKLREVELPE